MEAKRVHAIAYLLAFDFAGPISFSGSLAIVQISREGLSEF
uniref:Uncharacterized protein n=1 Tax=Rhizophora mucronata TaxID=61149 RepID=A0A2P2Q4I0_RHIMU